MQFLRYAGAASALVVAPVTLLGCGSNPTPGPPPSYGDCADVLQGTPLENEAEIPARAEYDAALKELNMTEVNEAMRTLLTTDNPCFPADNAGDGPNYGGLMIRLAWHCAGTYRASDGKGGCGGGRQRFEPERSWPDNANLDKARALLYPLKERFGIALSWGDLFVLAGTVAYEMSGTPISKICFGRVDEANGQKSDILNEPCTPEQGNCGEPHGSTTVGLIYVNPEGPLNMTSGRPDPVPELSVAQIRRTFDTMGHSDEAAVALIGGGHTLGKAHGACIPPEGSAPFNPPNKAFADGTPIYQGPCGTGKGADTLTSGLEGPWTTNYFTWTNDYFKELRDLDWYAYEGPGGATQWKTDAKSGIIRLTTDMALLEDPQYESIVNTFANDINAFNTAFDDAWFKLTTTNVGGEWSAEAKCTDGSSPISMRSDAGPEFVV